MLFSSETTEAPGAMIVAPSSQGRVSVFSMCFPEEILNYDLSMDLGNDTDGVTLPDTYIDEMDMIGIAASLMHPHTSLILLLTCLEFLLWILRM